MKVKKNKVTNSSITFILLTLFIIIEGICFSKIFKIDDLIYDSILNRTSKKEISDYLNFKERWKWLSYILVPLLLLTKTSLIASTLYIGTFFFSKVQVAFKQLWAIVVSAEFVFLLPPVFKIAWFYFFQTNYKLEDIQYFYPLSALNIVGYKDLEPWFIYPFQILNIFELAYWLILAYYIGKATETNMDKGLKIVAYSYGPALLLWVVTIMFFTLNYS